MMGLGPHLFPAMTFEVSPMRHARATFESLQAARERLDDRTGTAVFYAMSGLFFGLFAFAIWYCPRHL